MVLVSHGADVVPGPGQQAHQFILRTIRVLVLIHQNVLEAPVVIVANFRRDFQQAHGFQQQIVEIERIRLAQLLAVLLVDMRDPFGLWIGQLQIDLLRIEHVVLRPGDMGQHGARGSLFVIDSEPPHDPFHHLLLIGLVVDNKVLRKSAGRSARCTGRNPQRFDIAPECAHAK